MMTKSGSPKQMSPSSSFVMKVRGLAIQISEMLIWTPPRNADLEASIFRDFSLVGHSRAKRAAPVASVEAVCHRAVHGNKCGGCQLRKVANWDGSEC